MPEQEKIVTDFKAHEEHLGQLKGWLTTLYYSEDFSTLFNRPVLTMLITGVDYLMSNLVILRKKYEARMKGGPRG